MTATTKGLFMCRLRSSAKGRAIRAIAVLALVAFALLAPATSARAATRGCESIFGSFRYGAANIRADNVTCSAARKTLRGWLERLPSGTPTKPFPRKYAGWKFTDRGRGSWRMTRKSAKVSFVLSDVS